MGEIREWGPQSRRSARRDPPGEDSARFRHAIQQERIVVACRIPEEVGIQVSVVVPAHNEELRLPRCLDALLAQDYPDPIEIVVVDNASTDGTARVACCPGITVVHEPERDYCCALIRGFGTARGDLIALTDADTVVPPDWVSRLVQEYERHPDVVAVGGNVVFDRPNLKG